MAIIDIENMDVIQMREVLQEGYIPFSKDGDNSDISAEFYCHKDVSNYDNLDWIQNPKNEATYHCVGFNAPKDPNLHVTKYVCPSDIDLSNTEIDQETGELITDLEALGCLPTEGVSFAYDNIQISANGNPNYIPTDFTVLGTTN